MLEAHPVVAAVTGGASLSLEIPVGSKHESERGAGQPKRNSALVSICAERSLGNKRLKASGSEEPSGSAASLPCPKALQRAGITTGPATSPAHPRTSKTKKLATEAEDVHGDSPASPSSFHWRPLSLLPSHVSEGTMKCV